MRAFVVRNKDIFECPYRILLPSHYDDDGVCHCRRPASAIRRCQWAPCSRPIEHMRPQAKYCTASCKSLASAYKPMPYPWPRMRWPRIGGQR